MELSNVANLQSFASWHEVGQLSFERMSSPC